MTDIAACEPKAKRDARRFIIEPDRTIMHCNICGWAYEYYAGLEEEWNYCPHCGMKNEAQKIVVGWEEGQR